MARIVKDLTILPAHSRGNPRTVWTMPLPFQPKLVLILPTLEPRVMEDWVDLPRWLTHSKVVTHPSSNRARCWLTSLIRTMPLTIAPRRQHRLKNKMSSLMGRNDNWPASPQSLFEVELGNVQALRWGAFVRRFSSGREVVRGRGYAGGVCLPRASTGDGAFSGELEWRGRLYRLVGAAGAFVLRVYPGGALTGTPSYLSSYIISAKLTIRGRVIAI